MIICSSTPRMPSSPVPSSGWGSTIPFGSIVGTGEADICFRGRFKSFPVQDDRYFLAMCFYIHGNPLRAGIVKKLSDYRWSSYPAYADKRSQPSWLTTDLVLGIGIGEAEGTFWRSSSRLWKRNGTPWKISGMDCTWEPKSSQRSVGTEPKTRGIEKSLRPGCS